MLDSSWTVMASVSKELINVPVCGPFILKCLALSSQRGSKQQTCCRTMYPTWAWHACRFQHTRNVNQTNTYQPGVIHPHYNGTLCCQRGWQRKTAEKRRLNQSFKTWAESAKETKLSEVIKIKKASDSFFSPGTWPQLTFVPPKGTASAGRGDGTSGSFCFDNVLVLI